MAPDAVTRSFVKARPWIAPQSEHSGIAGRLLFVEHDVLAILASAQTAYLCGLLVPPSDTAEDDLTRHDSLNVVCLFSNDDAFPSRAPSRLGDIEAFGERESLEQAEEEEQTGL